MSIILHTGKATTKFHSRIHHNRYGIQNWLVSKKYIPHPSEKMKVNQEEYLVLLNEFAASVEFKAQQHFVRKVEQFIQNKFSRFADFCNKKFNPVQA